MEVSNDKPLREMGEKMKICEIRGGFRSYT